MSIRELIIKSAKLTSEIDTVWMPLNEKHINSEKFSRKESKTWELVSTLRRRMVTDKGIYQQPMFNDQLNYLNSMISRTDQKPGKDAYIRLEELVKIYSDVKTRFEGLSR